MQVNALLRSLSILLWAQTGTKALVVCFSPLGGEAGLAGELGHRGVERPDPRLVPLVAPAIFRERDLLARDPDGDLLRLRDQPVPGVHVVAVVAVAREGETTFVAPLGVVAVRPSHGFTFHTRVPRRRRIPS